MFFYEFKGYGYNSQRILMKRSIQLLLIAFFFFSCTPEKVRIRPEKRISVTGKVRDVTSSSLAGIPVVSSGALGGYVSGSPYQVLGGGRTNTSGDFDFVSLDTYNSDFTVSINAENREFYKEAYASVHYVDQEDNHGSLLNLGNVVLPKKVDFTFSVENTSATQGELTLSVRFSGQVLYYKLMNGGITNEVPENYTLENIRTLHHIHYLNSGTFTQSIPTLEGTAIIISYVLPGEEEFRELVIPVTSQSNTYVFEY